MISHSTEFNFTFELRYCLAPFWLLTIRNQQLSTDSPTDALTAITERASKLLRFTGRSFTAFIYPQLLRNRLPAEILCRWAF